MTALTVRRASRRGSEKKIGVEQAPTWSKVVIAAIMVLATLYFIIPVVWLIIAATKSSGDLYSTPGFSFAHWSLFDNLSSLASYRGGIFWRWILNSAVYSVLGAFLTTVISALCGYALAVYEFRGKRTLMTALLISLLVPTTVLAQPIFLLLVHIGLNNNMLGVLLPSLVYPFGVMLSYTTTMSSVPKEMLEAARIDGAGEFRTFFTIAWRLMSTGLTTVILFSFVASWNSFLLPLFVLDDPQLYPVTLGLVDWSQQSTSVAGLGTLTIIGSLVTVVPIVLAFAVLQRFWRSGLTAGGVKF